MTNREKYGEQLLDLLSRDEGIALKDGKPAPCGSTPCMECDLLDTGCALRGTGFSSFEIAQWLNAEYKEPQVDWSTVAVDTKILVRDSEEDEWNKRYFSHIDDGDVYCFQVGATSWSNPKSREQSSWKYAKLAEDEECD